MLILQKLANLMMLEIPLAMPMFMVKAEMATPSRLLEHVAARIFKRISEQFMQISSLEVSSKIAPTYEWRGWKSGDSDY